MNFWKGGFTLVLGLISLIPVATAEEQDWFGVNMRLQSKEVITDIYKEKEFTGLIYDIDLAQSSDDILRGSVQFMNDNGEWSNWIDLSNDHHGILEHSVISEQKWENLVNVNKSIGFRFRFIMRSGPDNVLPAVKIKELETINNSNKEIDLVSNVSELAGFPFKKSGVNIISRSKWGADDSLNIAEEYEEEDWEALALFKENEYVDKVIHEVDGELLKWPLEYTKEVKFIAVHHTVSAGDLEDSAEAVRNIQKYHAVQRGWGDIGYHYLIDKKGNIYEGRAGGDMVIGAHSREINKVSIGIALIGDFQKNNPPEAMMKALTELIKEKADQHDLDVKSNDKYKDTSYPVLGGHRDYSATVCPGVHNYQLLRALRNQVQNSENNFVINKITSTGIDLESGFGSNKNINLNIKNTSGVKWTTKDTKLIVRKAEKGLTSTSRLILDTDNNQNGTFQLRINGSSVLDGIYDIEVDIEQNGKKLNKQPIMLSANIFSRAKEEEKIEISKPKETNNKSSNSGRIIDFTTPFTPKKSSSKPKTSTSKTSISSSPFSQNKGTNSKIIEEINYSSEMPDVRIHISKFEEVKGVVSGSSRSSIIVDGKKVDTLEVGEKLIVWKSGNTLKAGVGTKRWSGEVIALDGEVLTVENYENKPGWSDTINDNRFRGKLDFRINGDNLLMVNELGMEPYLKGLAEVPDSDEYEKAKTIATAARSYVYYYSVGPGAGKKFPGKPYDIDDSPQRSQKYLGYGFEERSSLNKKAVEATEGEIITWNGTSVVIPYFSQSDGRTRSASEVWNWDLNRSGYLLGVDDTYCKNGEGKLLGHGVGISGCGASEMADRGFTYKQIIDYYLEGVKVVTKY